MYNVAGGALHASGADVSRAECHSRRPRVANGTAELFAFGREHSGQRSTPPTNLFTIKVGASSAKQPFKLHTIPIYCSPVKPCFALFCRLLNQ